jgi:glycosyltransferase involved in cell wall biosynthesis
MMRGEVVLSTPVGQMPEIIQDGYNGFLCRTLDEFIARLGEFANNPDRLLSMRRNALASIQSSRSRESVLSAVQAVFDKIATSKGNGLSTPGHGNGPR